MRLTAQLERAEEGIERAREASRSCLRQCEDDNRGHRTIPDDAYDDDGEVDAGAIMCSVCDDNESYDVRNLGGDAIHPCAPQGRGWAWSFSLGLFCHPGMARPRSYCLICVRLIPPFHHLPPAPHLPLTGPNTCDELLCTCCTGRPGPFSPLNSTSPHRDALLFTFFLPTAVTGERHHHV